MSWGQAARPMAYATIGAMKSLIESLEARQMDVEQRWGEEQEEVLQTWMRSRRRGEHQAGK